MQPKHECHLFIIFAREAHRAVIFRRGPTRWTQIILWDTDTDTFIVGQWFKGKIHTLRCDVSPDGSKMVYFAAKHHRKSGPTTWTAISRPPYLTALAMWPEGDTWLGGGYFEDNTTVRIRGAESDIQTPDQPVPNGFQIKSLSVGLGDRIYYKLLLEKRGWTLIQGNETQIDYYLQGYGAPVLAWQKDSLDHAYKLLWTMQGNMRGYNYTYSLIRNQDGAEFLVESDEFADWDQQGRLVYVESGRLYEGLLRLDGIKPVELANFTDNQPELFKAPAWALTWDQDQHSI